MLPGTLRESPVPHVHTGRRLRRVEELVRSRQTVTGRGAILSQNCGIKKPLFVFLRPRDSKAALGRWTRQEGCAHSASLLLSPDSRPQAQRRREQGRAPRRQAGDVEGVGSSLRFPRRRHVRCWQELGGGREALDGTASPAGGGRPRGFGGDPPCWRAAPRSLSGGSKRRLCSHRRKPALSRPTGPPRTPASGHGDLHGWGPVPLHRVPVLMVYTASGHQPQQGTSLLICPVHQRASRSSPSPISSACLFQSPSTSALLAHI